MRSSETINELATSICQMQSTLEHASKSSENPFFKSHYADLVECIETARKPMANNGLSIVQGPSIREDGFVIVTSRLLHSSGQWIETDAGAMPKDSGPQSVGSVITYLRRYSLCAMLGLAAENDDDGNAGQGESHQHAPVACPECGETVTVRKSTKPDQPGYYCWKKLQGCGHTWSPGATAIKPEPQPQPKAPSTAGRKQPEKKTGESAADAISPLSAPRNRLDATSTFAAFKAAFANGLAICGPDDSELDTQWREYGATWLKSHLPSLQLTNQEHFDTVRGWIGEHLPDKKMQESVLKLLDAKEKVVLQAA